MEQTPFKINNEHVLEVMDYNKVDSVLVTSDGAVYLTTAKSICASECARHQHEYREVNRSEVSMKKSKESTDEKSGGSNKTGKTTKKPAAGSKQETEKSEENKSDDDKSEETAENTEKESSDDAENNPE